MTNRPITTYSDFWPYYLEQHRKPGTKALHIVGTALVFALLALAIYASQWRFALGAIFTGYFFAWVGHFFVERNRPATFTYPFWSLVSDFRLFFMFIAGRLDGEYRRYGLSG